MTHTDSTQLLETAPKRGAPDQPAWVTPTSRYLSTDLPILAMALMLAGQDANQIRATRLKPAKRD